MESTSALLPKLKELLPEHVEILTDRSNPTFKELMRRWSDIDLKIPAAIVLPTNEEEIQKTVQWAVQCSVPLVVKSGGHSEWSTIGEGGIIIDLTRYSVVEYHEQSKTAILRGSIKSKDVAVKLAEHGRCTALGNGNTVGAIGYFLGGGSAITNATTGYGAEQILSARMVDARGELVDVNQDDHPDLLWALRGAGQFFGVVTQLVIQTLPLSVLGNDKGVIWAGMFVFPLDRAREVAEAMDVLMNDPTYPTSGLIMTMAPPPERKPALMISARLTGDPADAPQAYKKLYDLEPLSANGGEIPLQNASDARAAIGNKGDFKRFSIVGLKGFDINTFLKTIDIWRNLTHECPDAISTAFNFQWDARLPAPARFETALGLRDVRFWQNNLIWHTDPQKRAKVDEYAAKCIATVRAGASEVEPIDFVNGTRAGPIGYRYRGAERLARLKSLKAKWDPHGVLTRQLL